MRAVAKEAGVATTSVYIHFSDRNVLLFAVIEELFKEQIAIGDMAEEEAARAGGKAWERLLARLVTDVKFGLERPGHYKALFEGRVVPRLDDTNIKEFERPLLERTKELIREIITKPKASRVSEDPERLALLVWVGLHGILSLQINKPTLNWPEAAELAE